MTGGNFILALSGGIGGAKLALGLRHALPDGALSVVANTGDDFEYLGLHVSPDIDTLLYTLGGCNNKETGWGRADETWSFMEETTRLGLDDWFRLGDRDLAVHVLRSRRLREGMTLSEITAELAERFGLSAAILPMSDEAVRTAVVTDAGTLEFQDYFVRRRAEPVVERIFFAGAEHAQPAPGFLDALASAQLQGVIVCPSNPYLSIDPMLAVPGVSEAIAACPAPVIAVSPIVQQAAIKGPTAKIMRELGVPVTADAVARHYAGLLDGFVIDTRDASLIPVIEKMHISAQATNTLMRSLEDRVRLARSCLAFLARLRGDATP